LKIEELIDLYARSPQSAALAKALGNVSMRNVFVEGLTASAAAVLFASVTRRTPQTILFILPDADEAGYFYQDLRQMLEEAYPQPLPKGKGESSAQTTPPFREGTGGGFFCSDSDYQTAELIGNKLMLHMAAAYKMIKGVEEEAVPQVQVLDQRQVLLSLLPTEFETKVLLDEAKAQGVPIRTANRWNEKWVEEGIVIKIKQGHYRKRLASA
jgi:hypothetical protein